MGPYLALPVLKSYLQEVEQYKVDIVDLNVEFYDDLLSFRHVEECCKRYRESKDSFSSNVQLTTATDCKDSLIENRLIDSDPSLAKSCSDVMRSTS